MSRPEELPPAPPVKREADSDDDDDDKPLVIAKKRKVEEKVQPPKKQESKAAPVKKEPVKKEPVKKEAKATKQEPKQEPKQESKESKESNEEKEDDDSDDSSSSSSSSESDDESQSDSEPKSKKKSNASAKKPKKRERKAGGKTEDIGKLFDMKGYELRDVAPLLYSQGVDGQQMKWWNSKLKKGVKWQTLEHNGVLFPPDYVPHGVKMKYDGKDVALNAECEEVATFYASMLESDHVKNPTFNKNFFADWLVMLGKNHTIKEFAKCDFRPIHNYLLEEKERKKEEKKKSDVKQKLKEEKEAIMNVYGYCLVDGCREKVGNFRVEPPALFRGRGKHPKTGKIKRRIRPEDITINIAHGVPIPRPPAGHKWKGIVHNPHVTWLAFYRDSINGDFKYVFLSASSRFKGESDIKKYHTAANLMDKIEEIRDNYKQGMKSDNAVTRQISTAVYLIDFLALRVGNEKDTSERADTVGCCSLRVEHMTLTPPRTLKLDFLGKDSMRYENECEISELAYKNLESFSKNKKRTADIFDRITTSVLNDHLKTIMPGLTAKVFRTFNASITLEKELRECKDDVDDDAPEMDKVVFYNRANREVAKLCNHQKSVAKGFEGQMQRLKDTLAKYEAEKEAVQEKLDEVEGGKKKKSKKDKDKDDDNKKKLPDNPDSLRRLLDKLEKQIRNSKGKVAIKDDTKTVALGTSKINYCDPRISVAWCKAKEVPIEKVFNRSLLDKFPWAMEVPSSWKFTPKSTAPPTRE